MQFKNRWSPSISKHPRLKNLQCWNPFFIQHVLFPMLFISIYFLHFFLIIIVILKVWVDHWKFQKNNYSPNDRFQIKIFIKIVSLDSFQRVPPMSPCPPWIITTVCPLLINHLSDPWDFNKSNGILLRSNWGKLYPKCYGSELLVIKGCLRKWPTR